MRLESLRQIACPGDFENVKHTEIGRENANSLTSPVKPELELTNQSIGIDLSHKAASKPLTLRQQSIKLFIKK